MDSFGLSFIAALSAMKPGLTYVVSTGVVKTSDSHAQFSMNSSPIMRPELAVVFLLGYFPLILAADGSAIDVLVNANNDTIVRPISALTIQARIENSFLTVSSSSGNTGANLTVTGFIFGFL